MNKLQSKYNQVYIDYMIRYGAELALKVLERQQLDEVRHKFRMDTLEADDLIDTELPHDPFLLNEKIFTSYLEGCDATMEEIAGLIFDLTNEHNGYRKYDFKKFNI